ADDPAVPQYREDLAKCHNSLGILLQFMTTDALSAIRAGKVEKALAEAPDPATLKQVPAALFYNLARLYSLASAKDVGKGENYAKQAVDLLRQAVHTDYTYTDIADIKKERDLDPIRKRADFQKLMEDLGSVLRDNMKTEAGLKGTLSPRTL